MRLYPVDGRPRMRARLTGEYRAPRKGEYFLTQGQHVRRAASDLAGEYFICRLLTYGRPL